MSYSDSQNVKSLQDTYAPNQICYGCGPANALGLQLKSFAKGERVVATFDAKKQHQGFEGMINGGIIGTLLDCHMNWTAAWSLMCAAQLDTPPCTVTAQFEVTFQAPTPTTGGSLHLESWVKELGTRKAVIEATIAVAGKVTALGKGTFVAVKEGHPAYNRW